MNVFEERLAEGDLPEQWRLVVERLAVRARSWPAAAPALEDFWVWEPISCPESRDGGGLLVWADLVHGDGRFVRRTLGAQLDRAGLRCGELNSHSPGSARELDDFALVVPAAQGRSPHELADALLDWFVHRARKQPEVRRRLD
ncbi:hypothetical protein ACH4E7_23785 [Kitasatospora sp. NPDC018058]|uniref:hypothetical protein n=1 Tax=Kitasatospora sp. NPDC018058 TaxID=3364025 RepID=UPI0037BED70E